MIQSKIINKFFLSIFILSSPALGMDADKNSHLDYIQSKCFDFYNNRVTTTIEVYEQPISMRIGYIVYTLYEKTGVLDILDITAEQQKKGIGSKLFLMVMDEAKNKQIRSISWLSKKNASTFYQRFGAKIVNYDDLLVNKSHYHVDMEFVFDRDGDPKENLKQYYLNKPTRN